MEQLKTTSSRYVVFLPGFSPSSLVCSPRQRALHLHFKHTLRQQFRPRPRLPNRRQHCLVRIVSHLIPMEVFMTLPVGASQAFSECVVVDDDLTALICRDRCQPCDYPGPFHRHPMGGMVSSIPPTYDLRNIHSNPSCVNRQSTIRPSLARTMVVPSKSLARRRSLSDSF